MKKSFYVFVLLALLLSACNTDSHTDAPRDFSTPSSRLVGRWKSKADIKTEKYFSAIDPNTGEGTYTEYNTEDGTVFTMQYMIISEAPAGEKLTILYWAPDGTRFPHADLVVPQDGLRVRFRDYYIEYIDNKTEFDTSNYGPIPTLVPVTEYLSLAGEYVYFYETEKMEFVLDVFTERERLLPVDGASTAYCDPDIEEGLELAALCQMYSPRLGKNGWLYRFQFDEILP